MSFGTKYNMWWGTVKGNVEHFFGKEQKRLVTHEYYDNPNKPSERPRSMHTIASQSKRSIQGDGNRSRGPQGFNKSQSNMGSRSNSQRKIEYADETEQYDAVGQDEAPYAAESQMVDGMRGADMAMQDADGTGQYHPVEGDMQMQPGPMMNYEEQQQQQQWGQAVAGGVDPNMMMYPQDPNATGYDQQGVVYPQDQSMFPPQPYGMDANAYPQEGGYPQNQQYA